MILTDSRLLELGRRHLAELRCVACGATVRVVADADVLALGRALLAEHEAGLLRLDHGGVAIGLDSERKG